MTPDNQENGSQNGQKADDASSSHKNSEVPFKINQIEIQLNKDIFTEGETIKGNIFVNVGEVFYPKKLTLSIIGELFSLQSVSVKKQKSIKKTQTQPFPFDSPALHKQITVKSNKPVNSPTLLRTLTISSKKKASRFNTGQNTLKEGTHTDGMPPSGNRELFVHYSVPIFTFKTHKLPAGKYQFPFSFQPSAQMMASFSYDDRGFRMTISYSIQAELDSEKDDEEEEDNVIDSTLRTRKELKIAKASPKNQLDLNFGSIDSVPGEVSSKLSIPTLFCCASKTTELTLRITKNSFKLGEVIQFQLESLQYKFDLKQCTIKSFLVEEIATHTGHVDSQRKPLTENQKITLEDKDSKNIGSNILGEALLPQSMLVTFQTPNLDIEHFLEIQFSIKGGFAIRGKTTLKIPVIIKQAAGTIVQPSKSLSSIPDENDEDDIAMVMPVAKFKLEEKFNFLSRTANALNEIAGGDENQNGEDDNRFFKF